MWGLSSRGIGLGERRRGARVFELGLARGVVRGPLEHAIVELSGEIDFTCALELRRRLAELPHRIASIDVSQLEFVDAEGVIALREAIADRAVGDVPAPTLVGMTPAVERTFALVARRDGIPV